MKLAELLRDAPPPFEVAGIREKLRRALGSSADRIVVVDDDPTGTQTVHGVWVTTDWSREVLEGTMDQAEPVFYVSTNSRSLSGSECEALSFGLGESLRAAARATGKRIRLASRSDSTLRGHFPGELLALCRGLGLLPRAVLLVPAFFEGGRYTVGDVHWVDQGGDVAPAAETEFARDPTFGYRSKDLKEWVQEKTLGAIDARDVASIGLERIRRGGPEAVAAALREICRRPLSGAAAWPLGPVVVVNAACYDDLDVVAAAVSTVESEGIPLAYRCAASFVRSRGGFDEAPPIAAGDLVASPAAGLVVVGSYVERTTRQLETLRAAGIARFVELGAEQLVDPLRRAAAVEAAREEVDRAMGSGQSVVAYTSRATQLTSRSDFLDVGRLIMRGLCDMVRALRARPAWLVAKGGITSIEIARSALGVRRALVLGQVAKGVPVWRLGEETALPGVPYVVFPGNVGDERALLDVVAALGGHRREDTR